MDKEKSFVSVVVYIRNSEEYIEKFMASLYEVLKNNFNEYEIICVDDASNDQAVTKLKAFFAGKPDCTANLITLSYFQGVEKAMNAGIDMAIGDMVFEFDCTVLDFDPLLIMDVFHKAQEGFDIVSASPRNIKRIGTSIYYKLIKTFNKNIGSIQTETFRVISRRALNRVESMNSSVPFRQILYSTCGLKQTTLKYDSIEKQTIKLEHNYRRELAAITLLIFTNIAEKCALCCMFAELIIAVYLLIAEGLCAGSCIAFSMTGAFLLFWIVLKYLSILKGLVFTKQKYIIDNVEKINNHKI